MTRLLVVCADGTWNTPGETTDGTPTPTNVSKLHDAVVAAAAAGAPQLAYYHQGVGTTGSPLDRAAGAAFGDGLDQNIQDCYRWLVTQYQADDQIFLFGFSRGAYTVRSLAGFIRNCGLLAPEHLDKLGDAYAFYRDRTPGTHPASPAAVAFRAAFARDVATTFIGVWDTVGALGIPIHVLQFLDADRYTFHDVDLSSTIRYAYQALAIDEQRVPFEPCVWHQQPAPDQTLEQTWFAGVHSNVGGGYAEARPSDITLRWMARRAHAAGLGVPDALLNDPAPDPGFGTLGDSMSTFYQTFGRLVRTLRQPCVDAAGAPIDTKESLHRSALDRWSSDDAYVAPNLLDYVNRYPTDDPNNVTV